MADPETLPKVEKEKKKLSVKKLIIYAAIALGIFLVAISVYAGITLRSVSLTPPSNAPSLQPTLSASFLKQDILYADNGTTFIPYALFNYTVTNATFLFASVSILSSRPPQEYYLLNSSNECISCGNTTAFEDSLNKYLSVLGSNAVQVQVVSPGLVSAIPNDSVLIIPNGRLPDFMLNNLNGKTLLESILDRGVVVIYIGRDFSQLVSSQSVLIPDPNPPWFLATGGTGQQANSSYYFSSPSFAFSSGRTIGPITYEPVGAGYMIAFSNYLTSWPNESAAGSDVVSAIAQHFWINVIAQGITYFQLPSASKLHNTLGVLLNMTSLPSDPATLQELDRGYAYAEVYATYGQPSSTTKVPTASKQFSFQPKYNVSGSFDMPNSTFPGQLLNATITLLINSKQIVEPHIDIYTKDMQYVTSLPPFFSRNLSQPFTFLTTMKMPVGTGSYIAQVNGFAGEHYASAYFTVPSLYINLYNANFSNATFYFDAYAIGRPVTNVTAQVSINGQYAQNLTIDNGTFKYALPQGATVPEGNITFSVETFHTIAFFTTVNAAAPVVVNKQYIEFIIALVIVILEVTLVKAPNRDEFFIDVSSLPGPPKTSIKLKYNDIIGVFDKLNLYYHWKYMPLSRSEVRFAISSNVRISNTPAMLTNNNVELLLDNLVQKGYLISADDLYAPISWIEQSKHDIDYLATFKKLRVYLVAHAHIFTDLDKSDMADIVTTLHNEKAYLVIYSKTSKFMGKLPIQNNIKTYLVFLNADKMEEFKSRLYSIASQENEQLKMYISIGTVGLIDADNPENILT
ncbi:MAG: hypothetical protein LVQ95_01370 [Candidatus Micrarchaeales archaeon]|nr:hypothetical protein [Candidatus Micrarchaeales archaeon]